MATDTLKPQESLANSKKKGSDSSLAKNFLNQAREAREEDQGSGRGLRSIETASASLVDRLLDNRRALAIGVLVVLAVAVGAGVLANLKERREAAASSAFFEARELLVGEAKVVASELATTRAKTVAPGAKVEEANEPNPAAVDFAPLDVDAKFPKTVAKLREVARAHAGTRAGYEAQLLLGQIYVRHGQPALGLPALEVAVQAAPAGMEKALALRALGVAQENSGNAAGALNSYDQALKSGQDGLRADLLLSLARTQETAGKATEASATYDKVVAEFPGTDTARSAELFKANLK